MPSRVTGHGEDLSMPSVDSIVPFRRRLAARCTGRTAAVCLRAACVGVDFKAGQPSDITWRPGYFSFHVAHRPVVRRKARPILDEFVPSKSLHAEAIRHRGFSTAWPNIELGNTTGNRDDQL